MCAVVYLFWGGYAKKKKKKVSMYFWRGSGGSLTRMKNVHAKFIHCIFCAVTNTVVDRSKKKKKLLG